MRANSGRIVIAGMFPEHKRRLEFAVSHIEAGMLETAHIKSGLIPFEASDQHVKLSVFRKWGEGLPTPFPFPDQFPREAIAAPQDKLNDKPLGKRERDTLLRIIGVLAKQAKLDLTEPYKAGEVIAAMLDAAGINLGAQTIANHLIRASAEIRDAR
jgi:hypothetical protein